LSELNIYFELWAAFYALNNAVLIILIDFNKIIGTHEIAGKNI
jgi:hypothetical protein